jgi:hypothetical protein
MPVYSAKTNSCAYYRMSFETMSDSGDKAVVVFQASSSLPLFLNSSLIPSQDASGVYNCMGDPKRHLCQYRPADNRLASTQFEITIKQLRPELMTRTVWIRITGPRADDYERARSASPKRHVSNPNDMDVSTRGRSPVQQTSKLPEKVSLYAVPVWNWSRTKINWTGKVREPGVSEEQLYKRIQVATGKVPVPLREVDMRRRVPEKDASFFRRTLEVKLTQCIDHPGDLQSPR